MSWQAGAFTILALGMAAGFAWYERKRPDARIVALVQQDDGARPITPDLPALIRTLAATTMMTLTHDSAFIGTDQDVTRAVEIVERLWLPPSHWLRARKRNFAISGWALIASSVANIVAVSTPLRTVSATSCSRVSRRTICR